MAPFDPALLRHLPGTRGPVRLLAAVGVVAGGVALAQAVALAWTVTVVATGGELGGPLALLVGLVLLRGVVAALAEVVARRAGHTAAAELRVQVLHRWLRLPEGRRPTDEEAVTLAGSGVSAVEPYVARYLPALVTGVVVPALSLLVLVVVDPWSALIVALTLPLLPVFAALIGVHTRAETDRRWAAMSQLSGHFLDVVKGLPTLVSYGRAEAQVDTVRAVGARHRDATVRTLRTAFMSTAALELLATISVALVAVAVGLRLAYGAMDLQVGLTAILLAPEAYWPVRRVGQEFHNAADGSAALEQLLTDDEAVDRDSPPAGSPVRVESVGYAHSGRPDTLAGLTLLTPAGPGLTVLTGPSGAGKTTLLELLAGLRTPHTGTIAAPPSHLATQRPLVLPGPVLETLRLASPDAAESACRGALERVGLWPDLAAREGLVTELGDDGFGLSAGQRTRLALARALLAPQPLVLLDEPTAHVAAGDVPALHAAVTALATTRRVVVATHDDDLVSHADSHWVLSPLQGPDPAPAPAPSAHPEPSSRTAGDPPAPASAWQRSGPRSRLAAACLLGGLSVAAGVALTATSGWLIVQASFQPVVLTLLVAIVGVRAFGLARPLLRYAERVVSHDVALADLAEQRTDVYARLVPLTPARLGRRHRGDVLTAVVRDLDDVVDEQVRVTVPWWSTVIASAVAVGILVAVLPWAGLALAVGAGAALAVGALGHRLELAAQGAAVRARGDVLRATTAVTSRLTQVQAVTGCGATGGQVLDEVRRAQDRQGEAEGRLIRGRAVALALEWAVVAATTAVVGWLAWTSYRSGDLVAPLAALVALTPMALADAFTGLPEVAGARARSRAAGHRLAAVLDQKPAVAGRGTGPLLDATPVSLVAVTASWTGQRTDLAPFSLEGLVPGDRLQLTGPNGAGKSTVLAVLARHLDPASGRHTMGGCDVLGLDLAATRAAIAVVDDEPHAFAGSIRANLALAAPGADESEMVSALHTVDLGGWLARQPDGLATTLTGLSGGERTRLAMARAVLSGRPVLLLDEPTAHLDDATAERAMSGVLAADDRDGSRRAVVVVSHRSLKIGCLDHREVGIYESTDAPELVNGR
jgi:ATP-binding cassette subfamily C protein CydCD